METDNTYPLPLVITPTFTIKLIIVFFLLAAICFAATFIYIDKMEEPTLLNTLIFYIFCPLMGLLFILAPIYQNIFKKNRITITKHNINLKSLFVNKEILWENVVDISEYSLNKNDFIGFVTKAKIKNLAKGGLGATFNASMGGLNEISIPLQQLGKLNRDKVINTITAHLIQQETERAEGVLPELDISDILDISTQAVPPTNRLKAFSLSILLTLASAFTYALSLYLFEANILIIPLIGIFIISFYYDKYVQVSDYNLIDKLWISFLGASSVLATKIIIVFVLSDITPSILNIALMAYTYLFEILPNDGFGELIWILVTAVVAVTGFSFGPPLNLFKKTQNQDL